MHDARTHKSESKMSSNSKLESLTVLRFVAAASVVIFHYGRDTLAYYLLPAVLAAGSIVVTFFFVLSGFVISIANSKRPIDIHRFYVDRLARIFPVYFVALILFVMAFDSNLLGADFLLSATMMQSWVHPYALTLNMPGWSISVEVFFYVVAPILIILYGRGASWIRWAVFALLLWLFTQMSLSMVNKPPFNPGFPSLGHNLINYFPVSHLCSFVLGFAGGVAYRQGVLSKSLTDSKKVILLVFFMAFSWLLSKNGKNLNSLLGTNFAYGSSFYSIVFLPIIYFCALANKIISKYIAFPFVVLLGEASYSLYILQMPVHVYFERVFSGFVFSGPEQRFWMYFAILNFLSIASYLIIEKPISTVVKNRFSGGHLKSQATS
jgi:peptidoglycan/LPS O-acetylase OafA/YrhL